MGRFVSLFVVLLACLTVAAIAQQCGRQAGGRLCPGGLCCNRFGYCGSTRDHCCDGCQSNCWNPRQCRSAFNSTLTVDPNQQCGWQVGGSGFCPGRLCCSRWGFCGGTKLHCCAGCQGGCRNPAACRSALNSSPTVTPDEEYAIQAGGQKAAN